MRSGNDDAVHRIAQIAADVCFAQIESRLQECIARAVEEGFRLGVQYRQGSEAINLPSAPSSPLSEQLRADHAAGRDAVWLSLEYRMSIADVNAALNGAHHDR